MLPTPVFSDLFEREIPFFKFSNLQRIPVICKGENIFWQVSFPAYLQGSGGFPDIFRKKIKIRLEKIQKQGILITVLKIGA
jgi:hypothetical protein